MTITVVKGTSAKAQTGAQAAQKNDNQLSTSSGAAKAATAASSSGSASSTDAAVANLRTKTSGGSEKVREYKQAKGLAGSVAENIRSGGNTNAHGSLDALSAREYFG